MKINLEYITTLVNYYNKLIENYDIPMGELNVQIEDGYTGTIYAIDFEYKDNSFILCNDRGKLIFSASYNYSSVGKCGIVSDYTDKEISDMVKRTLE